MATESWLFIEFRNCPPVKKMSFFLAKGWHEQSQGADQSYEGVFSINFIFIHAFLFQKFSSG